MVFAIISNANTSGISTGLISEIDFLKSQWVVIKQQKPNKLYTNRILNLTKTASQFVLNHPNDPHYLVWEARIYTLAVEKLNKFKGINYAKHARNSLLEATKFSSGIQLGYIYSNLGYLYLIAPKLSLSLKNNSKKYKYLTKGLQLNPEGLESNYYYGLYLLNKKNSIESAQYYLKKALASTETQLDVNGIKVLKNEIKNLIKDDFNVN
jgi:hypothetical protein